MSRIVLTWELGGNFGHIGRLSALARILASRGHEVFLLLKELHNLGDLQRIPGIKILQAPVWLLEVKGLPDPPMSYSEMLLRYGYHDAKLLQGLAEAWCTQFDMCKADVVVADHSPTALLAARMLGIPAAALGSGFFIPPRQAPMPSIRPWLTIAPRRFEQADGLVLATLNTLLERHSKAPLEAVSQLFDLPTRFLMTFPELDHYLYRPEPQVYYGVDYLTEIGETAAWPEGEGVKVYAYLDASSRDFETVLQALRNMNCRALVYARGISANTSKALEAERVRIYARPLRLADILADCDVGIAHASLATVTAFLMNGLPMLLIPTQLEQFLIGMRAEAIGAAHNINPDLPAPDYEALLHELMDNPQYRLNAREFANKYKDWDRPSLLEKIAVEIEHLVTAA